MIWSLLGAAVGLLGLALEAWALLVLGWRRACDLDDAPPDPARPALVLSGPFRYVRHPQSLGLVLLAAAAALHWRTPAMWLLAMVAAGLVIWMAERDDRVCARRFGDAYARYRLAAPFLLPRRRRAARGGAAAAPRRRPG